MMSNEEVERLLIEHVALKRCGLLKDPSGRLPEVPDPLAPGAASPTDRESSDGPGHTPIAGRRSWSGVWLRLGVPAAAAALVILGIWSMGRRPAEPPGDPAPHSSFYPAAAVEPSGPPIPIARGQGRFVPMGPHTQFEVLDAQDGHVRLANGDAYVELPSGAGLRARIETPVASATALGTQFCVHYGRGAQGLAPFLAVAVLGGAVEVSNPLGRVVGNAGEVVVAREGLPPKTQAQELGVRAMYEWRRRKALGLAFWPPIQRELGLSEEQKEKLAQRSSDEPGDVCSMMRRLHDLSRDERTRLIAEFHDHQQRKIDSVLLPPQLGRLAQIGLQYEGLLALVRPDVAERVGLTDEQSEQLDVLATRFGLACRELFESAGPPGPDQDWSALRRKQAALRERTEAEIGLLLSPQQQEAWQVMLGAPFFVELTPQDYERFQWESRHRDRREPRSAPADESKAPTILPAPPGLRGRGVGGEGDA